MRRIGRIIPAMALGLLVAGCGSPGAENGDGEVIRAGNGASGDAVAVGRSDDDEDGSELGSVNLPRPAWLPADFPLPADAHIYITVANEQQSPKIYMIQARTRSGGDPVANAVVAWAKSKGLEAERLQSHSDKLQLASFSHDVNNSGNLQVHVKPNGVNNIILAVTGSPWN